jgi:hypothetical protein
MSFITGRSDEIGQRAVKKDERPKKREQRGDGGGR